MVVLIMTDLLTFFFPPKCLSSINLAANEANIIDDMHFSTQTPTVQVRPQEDNSV